MPIFVTQKPAHGDQSYDKMTEALNKLKEEAGVDFTRYLMVLITGASVIRNVPPDMRHCLTREVEKRLANKDFIIPRI